MTFAARARRTLRVSAVLAAVALVAGCTSDGPDPTPPSPAASASPSDRTDPASDPALTRFYGQTVRWSGCGDDLRCAKVTVPLDWSKPAGETVQLALLQLRATKKKIGTMLVNPGGPGVSSTEWLRASPGQLGSRVLRSYDVVAWDPRGVGASTPLRCLQGAEQEAFVAAEVTPDSPAEVQDVLTTARGYAAKCEQRSGALLGHVDTVSTAKDMDVIRAALGEKLVSFYGWSYGTYIGSWYAELFPWRVGRMVLDGAVDPSLTAEQYAEGQAKGFSGMATAFVADCVKRSKCPLRGSTKDGLAQIGSLLAEADAEPLPTTDGRQVTQSVMTTGFAFALYLPDFWPQLRTALQEAFRGQGDGFLALADAYFERQPDGEYGDTLQATTPIFCLDHPETRTVAQIEADAKDWLVKYPPFGDNVAWGSVGCLEWPVKPVIQPQRLEAPGAPPILVVGTTGDPATPYEWAKGLASQLKSARLLTFEGDGHTAYRRGSKCVDTTIEDYLVAGTFPTKDVTCS